MRIIRLVLASALCPMGSTLAQDAGGHGKAAAQILVGVGLGRRESPWRGFTGSHYSYAGVARLSARFGTERVLVFEPELGYWQEARVKFRDDVGREFSVTTRFLSVGLNVLLHPQVGRIHLRAGGGAGVLYHHDAGNPPVSEVVLGLNLQLGAELDISDRIGVFGVIRGETVGTASLAMLYGGLRIRSR